MMPRARLLHADTCPARGAPRAVRKFGYILKITLYKVEIGEQLLQLGLVLIVQNIVKEFILIAYRLDILKGQKILKKKNGKKNLILIK